MKKRIAVTAIVIAVAIIAAASGYLIAQGRMQRGAALIMNQPTAAQLVPETQTLSGTQETFRAVARKALPVVVEINVTSVITQQVPQLDFPFNWFFNQQGPNSGGQQRTFRQSALGSGIIVQRSGDRYYVLTNNHVVANATDVSVTLNDQKVYSAKIVGTDSRKDLAMVSFTTRDVLPVAELGDSNGLQVGDIVLAVGNPFGYESSITMGIVSALGRRGPPGDASTSTDYIQTDAAINQGNSGGALVNIEGQVIGINTWIAAPNGGNIGLGFAIPIDNAMSDINGFITKGKVQYGWIGVEIADIQDASTYPGRTLDSSTRGQARFDLMRQRTRNSIGLTR